MYNKFVKYDTPQNLAHFLMRTEYNLLGITRDNICLQTLPHPNQTLVTVYNDSSTDKFDTQLFSPLFSQETIYVCE